MTIHESIEFKSLTKDQKSLLLFLESRAVDHGGLVATEHMNGDDMLHAKNWNEIGFIGFGRLVANSISTLCTHWVTLSEEAWQFAHAERRARNQRLFSKRTWKKN
jgi:hypothetical protein